MEGGSDVHHSYPIYDICVVGAGMIGSAIAKHVLEIDSSLRVALVGPCEIKVEVRPASLDRYQTMPCVVVRDDPKVVDGVMQDYSTYILPPVRYPDGNYYIKLGHANIDSLILKTPEEIHRWYCHGGGQALRSHLLTIAKWYLPELPCAHVRYDSCVSSHTATGYVYIDMLTPKLGVAMGGCGQAAKSSDEIGRIAARMIVKGHWDYDLPASTFRYHSVGGNHSKL